MRALLMVLFGVLSLVALSCGGDDGLTVTREPLATPRPAPTIEGVLSETAPEAVATQAVVVGIPEQTIIEVRAQPGIDKPLVAELSASVSFDPMGQLFTTEDGLVWWQVRAEDVQGWVAWPLAYRGPATTLTDIIPVATGGETFASAEDAAAAIVARVALDRGTAESVVIAKSEIAGQNSVSITSDVLVRGDSLAGVRLIVAASATNGAWQPVSVTQFELCSLGVSAAGLCL